MASAPTTMPTGAAINPAPQPVPPVSTSVSQPVTSGTTDASQATTNYNAYSSYGYPYGNNQYSYNGQYDAAAYAQYYNAYNSYYGYGQYNYQYNHTGQYNNYSNYYQTNQNQTQQTYTTTVATSQTQTHTTMPNTAVPPPPLPSTIPSYSTTPGTSKASVVTTTTSILGQVIPPPPPPLNMLSSLSTATTTVSSSVSAPPPPPAASQGVVAPSVSQATSTATPTPGLASIPAPPVMPSNFGTYSQPSSMMYPPPALNSQQYRPQNNMQNYSTTQSAFNNYNYQYGAHNFQTPPPPLPNSATPSTSGASTQSSQMKQPVVPFQPSVPPPNYPSYQHTYPYHNYNYTNQQMPPPYSSNGQTGYVNQAAPNQANSTYDVNSAAFSTPHQNNFSQKKAKVTKKKKGAGNSNDQPLPTVNNQLMNSSSSDMLTDKVRSDEKLVLRKDIGPANIARPKGTFACLLGTVDFEIDEYDQSTESESDSDDSENKTTGKEQKEKSKLQSKSAYPKPAKVTKPVIPLDDLEMNPEAFGLPTKFVGRGPKVLPEDEEEETRFSETQNDYPYHKAFQEKHFGRTRNQFNRPNFGQRTNDFENPWNENNNWKNFRNETNINDQPGKNTKVDPNILEASGQPSHSLKQRENELQSILKEMSERKPLMNPNLKHHPNIGGEGNFNRNNSKSLNSSVGWPENEKVNPDSYNVDAEDFDGRFQNYDKSELHAAFGGCEDKPPVLQDENGFANRNMPPNISSFHLGNRSDNFKEKPFYGKPFQKVNSDKFEGGYNENYNQSSGNDRFGSKFPTCKNQPCFNRNPNTFSGNAKYGELNKDSNYDVIHKRQFDKPNFAGEEHEESFNDAKNSFSKDGANRSNFRQGPSNWQFGNVNEPPFNSFDNFGKQPFGRFDMSSIEKTDDFGDNTMQQFGEELGRGSFSKNKKMPLLKDPMLTDKKHMGGQFPGNDIRPPFRSNQSFGDGKRQGMQSFEMDPPIKPPFMDKNFSKNDSQSAFMHPPPIRHPPPPFNEIKQKGNLSKDNNFPPLPPPPFLENMKMLGSFDRNEMQPPRPPFDKPSPNIPFGKMNEPNSQSNFSDDRRTFGDHHDRTIGLKENFKDKKFGQRDHPQNKLDSIHGKNTNKDEDRLLGKNKISEPSRRKKSRFDKEEPIMDNQLESPFNRNFSNPEKPFRKTSRFEDIKSDENSKLKEKNSEKFDGSFHQESSPVKKARKFFSDTPQPVATQSILQDEAKKSSEISNKQPVTFTKLVGTKTEKSNEIVGNKVKEAKDKQATVVKNQNVTANTSPSPKPLLKVETKNSQKEKSGIVDNSVMNSYTSQPKELKDSIADSAKDSVKSKLEEMKDSKEDRVKDTQKESHTKVSEPSFVKKPPLSSISFLERLTSGSKSFKKSVSTSSKAPETQSMTKEKKPTSTASVSGKTDVIPHKSKTSPQSNSTKDSASKAPEIPSTVTSASHISKSPSSIAQSISPSVSASPITKNTSVNLTTTTCSSPVISTTSMTSSSSALPSLPVKQSASEIKAASATVTTAAKPSTDSVSKEQITKPSTDLTKSLSWFTSSSPKTSVNKATAGEAKVEVTTPNVTSDITSSTMSMEKKIISELSPKNASTFSTTTVVSTASYAHTAITTTSVSKEPVKLLPSTTQLKTSEESMEREKISSEGDEKLQPLDTIPITTTPKPTASSSPLKESNPLSDIFGLDKDTIQPPVMLSTQPLIPNLPKTNDELLEDLILKVNDTSLRELMQPDFCKLCDVHHPASIVALQHYRSKGHANKVDTFLSIKANLEKNKARVHGDDARALSQPCEVEFQCPDDASKPYFGDDHASNQIEHKPTDRKWRRRDNPDHGLLESRGILDAGRGRGRGNRRMMRESRPFDRPEQIYFESENSPDRSPFDPFDVPNEPTFDSPQLENLGRRLDGCDGPPFNRHDEPPFNRGDGPPFNRHDGPRLDRLDGPSFNRSDRPPFNRHGKPPHDRHKDPSFNRFDDPPFNRHDEPPFNRHDGPPFSRHDGPPLDMSDDPSLGRRERSSFDRPPCGRGGGRGRGRGRGNLNSLLDMPIGPEMEDFDDVPEFDMEMPRHRPRGRGGQMSRRQGRPQDFEQEDMAARGRQFRQEFRGRGRPDKPEFKRGFQPRFNPMDDRGPPFDDFGPGPSPMKRPRKRFN